MPLGGPNRLCKLGCVLPYASAGDNANGPVKPGAPKVIGVVALYVLGVTSGADMFSAAMLDGVRFSAVMCCMFNMVAVVFDVVEVVFGVVEVAFGVVAFGVVAFGAVAFGAVASVQPGLLVGAARFFPIGLTSRCDWTAGLLASRSVSLPDD